jgi:transcriptional repressor NF-X1
MDIGINFCKGIYVKPSSASCSATRARARPARHLHLTGPAPVGSRSSCGGVRTAARLSPVAPPCERMLPCKRHHCEKVCHTGPCGDCSVVISARCFCGKKNEALLCGDMVVKGKLSEEDGVFSCSEPCGHTLACGNHVCKDMCHLGPCGECELMPRKVTTCHCGKTRLQESRASCLDPIPTCDKICDKKLPCGVHSCNLQGQLP